MTELSCLFGNFEMLWSPHISQEKTHKTQTALRGRSEIAMFEDSKTHLNWILKQEDSQGSRTKSDHRKCVLATIIEERVNKMLMQIDNDEREGFLPNGSLDQARRELGYTVD